MPKGTNSGSWNILKLAYPQWPYSVIFYQYIQDLVMEVQCFQSLNHFSCFTLQSWIQFSTNHIGTTCQKAQSNRVTLTAVYEDWIGLWSDVAQTLDTRVSIARHMLCSIQYWIFDFFKNEILVGVFHFESRGVCIELEIPSGNNRQETVTKHVCNNNGSPPARCSYHQASVSAQPAGATLKTSEPAVGTKGKPAAQSPGCSAHVQLCTEVEEVFRPHQSNVTWLFIMFFDT